MMEKRRFILGETCIDATVEPGFIDTVDNIIFEARSIVESKIWSDPIFGITYDPYEASYDDDALIIRMCEASISAGVGPMASVAGAIAAYVLETLIHDGCGNAVINNGGDIAMISHEDVCIAIWPGNSSMNEYGMVIEGSDGVIGICSSSGRIGHSVSFGDSDICTVMSNDPVLADAAATRLANDIRPECDVGAVMDSVNSIHGVNGCLTIMDDIVAVSGDIPKIVLINHREKEN